MQFKKKEIPRVIAARERSLAYYHEKFAEEPWIHMPVVPKSVRTLLVLYKETNSLRDHCRGFISPVIYLFFAL